MITKTLIIALSMILAVGCFDAGSKKEEVGSTDQKTDSSDAERTVSENVEKPDAGICTNDYYPIDSETKREYKVIGDVPGKYVLTQQNVKPDSFTELRVFGSGLEVKVNWICTEDGLRTAELNNTANFSKGNFEMETIESSGVTLPKEWSEGKSWESAYKVRADLSAGPAKGSASGTVTIKNKILSMNDLVEIDGKEFETIKVESVMRMKLSMNKRQIPTRNITMTNWYSKETGLLKQTAKTQFGQTGIEYVGKQ